MCIFYLPKCKIKFTFGRVNVAKCKFVLMKTILPYPFRKVGIVIFLISIIVSFIGDIDHAKAGFYEGYHHLSYSSEESMVQYIERNGGLIYTVQEQKTFDWVGIILSLSGLLMYVFAKERVEDEFIEKLRMNCLAWAVASSWLLFFLIMVIRGSTRFEVLYALQTQMLIYVVLYVYQKKWKYGV